MTPAKSKYENGSLTNRDFAQQNSHTKHYFDSAIEESESNENLSIIYFIFRFGFGFGYKRYITML